MPFADEPFSLVIFGASGDLTRRKLIPALWSLYAARTLPEPFTIIATARTEMTDEVFRGEMRGAVGEFAREMGERFGVARARRANLLDVTVCIWPFLLPWFVPTILAASQTAGPAGAAPERVGPLSAGFHNLYLWGLAVVLAVAVGTGYGRGGEDAVEPPATG